MNRQRLTRREPRTNFLVVVYLKQLQDNAFRISNIKFRLRKRILGRRSFFNYTAKT